jgi:hypothetical protein
MNKSNNRGTFGRPALAAVAATALRFYRPTLD